MNQTIPKECGHPNDLRLVERKCTQDINFIDKKQARLYKYLILEFIFFSDSDICYGRLLFFIYFSALLFDEAKTPNNNDYDDKEQYKNDDNNRYNDPSDSSWSQRRCICGECWRIASQSLWCVA